MSWTSDSDNKRLIYAQLAWLFFRMGLTAFGGPAAHIAIMEREVVEKRKWITRDHFMDLVGATNLIPGPNSTEMAIHIGYIMGGWLGLIISGFCFIVPAIALTILFSWFYVLGFTSYQEIMQSILFGVIPVVLAIIIGAIWRLGYKVAKGIELIILGLTIIPFAVFFPNQTIIVLLGGGILGMFATIILKYIRNKNTEEKKDIEVSVDSSPKRNKKKLMISAIIAAFIWGSLALILWLLTRNNDKTDPTYLDIIWYFYGVGSILYGSGYVLYAYIEGDLVGEFKWLKNDDLTISIALGQFTPGPILSTTAAVGFIIATKSDGLSPLLTALLSALGIFLPSFLVVVILNPLVKQARQWKWAAAFLDAINISSISVMLVVTGRLGYYFFTGPQVFPLHIWDTLVIWRILIAVILIGLATLTMMKWKKLNSAIIVLGGALVGGLIHWVLL